jgi:hypothetical protein
LKKRAVTSSVYSASSVTSDDILSGIDAELKESQRAERLTVEAKQKYGWVWKFWLNPGQLGGRLDESLEGADAWWTGDQRLVGKGTSFLIRHFCMVVMMFGGIVVVIGTTLIEAITLAGAPRASWANQSSSSSSTDLFTSARREDGAFGSVIVIALMFVCVCSTRKYNRDLPFSKSLAETTN